VVPSHLMDRKLFPFADLEVTGEASEDGDKAFDDEPLPATAPVIEEDAHEGNALAPRAVIPIATH